MRQLSSISYVCLKKKKETFYFNAELFLFWIVLEVKEIGGLVY